MFGSAGDIPAALPGKGDVFEEPGAYMPHKCSGDAGTAFWGPGAP